MKSCRLHAGPTGASKFQFYRLIQLSLGLYLLLNVYINSYILITFNRTCFLPLFCLLLFSLIAIRKNHFFSFLLFVFGFTFFLFGFRSYDVQSRFFEMEVAVLSFIILVKDRSHLKYHIEDNVVELLLLFYCFLAFFSLLLLPLQDIFAKIRLWGIHDYAFFVLNATPELPEYSIAAVNRLLLFSLAACLLAHGGTSAEKYFQYIINGAVSGLVIAAAIGLLEYFNVLSLSWYVPGSLNKLHSLFLNRGWYAEYVICLTPLLFIGVCRRPERRRLYIPVIFVALLVIGVSILFTGARSGWGLFAILVAWSFFVFVGQGNLRQKVVKSLLFFLMTVLLLFVISLSAFKVSLVHDEPGVRSPKSMTAKQIFLQKRLKNLFKTGRIKNWQDTIHLIDGRFLFGRGYESFSRQAHILASIPSSGYKRNQQHLKIQDTAHNFYLQLIVSNGLIGLAVWLLLSGYAALVLLRDYRENDSCESMVVFMCILSFHLYGLTQSMQYVPMIWFLVFLFFSYAIMREKKVGMREYRKSGRLAGALSVFICLLAVSSYALNVGQKLEADRYGVAVFAVDQDLYRYRGFYPKELWSGKGVYRWSGRQAEIRFWKDGIIEISFKCITPGLGDNPLIFEVLLDGRIIDRHTFWEASTIKRKYWIPGEGDGMESILELRVSRTWNLRQSGMGSDTRNLGVAVSEPKFIRQFPSDDLGFYDWQVFMGEDREKGHRLLKYRWTRQEAVLNLSRYEKDSMALLLKSDQPYIEKYPVSIELLQHGSVIDSLTLHDHRWQLFSFPRQVNFDRPLTIRVNRTWNPRREGSSDDPRDLGVAVALVPADFDKEVSDTSKVPVIRKDTLPAGQAVQ